MVDICDTITECDGCISGPPLPTLSECQSNSTTTTTIATNTTTTTTTVAPGTTTTTDPFGPTTATTTVAPTTHTTTAQSQSCDDFYNGSCPMEESNIISSDLNIWSPDECQALCVYAFFLL